MPLSLLRPRVLAEAGRAGAGFYDRRRDLPRLAPGLFAKASRAVSVVDDLAVAEAECDADRRAGSAHYSIERHVSLLAALIAEAGAAG